MKPIKKLGQNFLIDQNVIKDLIASAGVTKADTILEIGAGRGVITIKLAKTAKTVMAVEYDQKLIPELENNLKNQKNVQIISADILRFNPEKFGLKNFQYKIVANIPFQITNKILSAFLENKIRPSEICIVVQQEVAEKICPKEGKASLFSSMVSFYGKPEVFRLVSKNAFFPVPKVDSAILKIKLRKNNPQKDLNEKDFLRILHIGFSSPRKKLYNNLKNGLHLEPENIKKLITKTNIRESARPSELSLEDWLKIYANV